MDGGRSAERLEEPKMKTKVNGGGTFRPSAAAASEAKRSRAESDGEDGELKGAGKGVSRQGRAVMKAGVTGRIFFIRVTKRVSV